MLGQGPPCERSWSARLSTGPVWLCVAMGVTALICVGLGAALVGCGDRGHLAAASSGSPESTTIEGGAAGSDASNSSNDATLPTPSSSSTSVGRSGAVADAMFEAIAERVHPMPVYAPGPLPSGVTPAEEWWPLLSGGTPGDAGQGVGHDNPRFGGVDPGPQEVQVLLSAGEGAWVMVVENFRGDLGDVDGDPVGEVGGHPAQFYEMDEGGLIQWSDGGLWYGVFGRNVPRETLVDVALGMSVIEVSEGG